MYKRKSRFILYLFAISLLCLCCLNTQAAGKKIAIKGVSKALKIPMGEKYYLEAKSKPITKLTYSSSNKSILKVSKKGVLNPRNVGKAKITIKARKKGKITLKKPGSVTLTAKVKKTKNTKLLRL